MSNAPTGTQVYLGNGTSVTDNSGLSNGQTYSYRFCAYDNAGNISNGATASATLTVNIQVTSSPPSMSLTVDLNTALAPIFATWDTASRHTISVASPQAGAAGTQYVFSSWSDGGAPSHSVAPAADTLYMATFTTQYTLTTSVSAGSGVVQPGCPGGGEFFTGPVNAGAPFAFVDGLPASGLACSFLALNDLTDCVDFSSNSGVDWSYIPNGSFDPAVTNVRFRLSGPMNANSGSGSPYFELRFRVRLK